MLRYLRLYVYFVRFSFSRAFEFRLDFFFRIVMDLVFYAVNILFYKLIFLHTGILAGWDENQLMVFVGTYLVVDAIYMTVFANNMWHLPGFINDGQLDYYILRPVSSLFFLSVRDFAANSFVNLVMAIGILVWALVQYKGPVGVGNLALFLVLILNGALLYHIVRILTLIPVFWMHSGQGLNQIFWSMSRFVERPDRIFKGWVRRILVSVLPFSLVASYPARIFLEEFDWTLLAQVTLVTFLLGTFAILLWRKGLRAYSSASS